MFELFKTNKSKIGMNANENKLYHINKLIVMDKLNWIFPRFKKHKKIQFLTFGNTLLPTSLLSAYQALIKRLNLLRMFC